MCYEEKIGGEEMKRLPTWAIFTIFCIIWFGLVGFGALYATKDTVGNMDKIGMMPKCIYAIYLVSGDILYTNSYSLNSEEQIVLVDYYEKNGLITYHHYTCPRVLTEGNPVVEVLEK